MSEGTEVARREAVVVTGASTGIGEAAAVMLARHGFLAYAGVRNDADAARVETLDEHVRALRIDVTDRASILAAAETVAAAGHPLRAVVNNAGVAVAGPLEFLPVDELRRQFEINVFGAMEVTQAFLPMLRPTRGRVVFVGSISGRLAVPFIAPYSASKFALRAISDALRIELGPAGIGVALVEPSSVKTPIWQKGRDSRDRLLALLTPKAVEIYGPQVEAIFAATQHEEKIGMPADDVANAILHAVTAPKPRARYLLGGPARAGSIVALLPPALRDRAIRASMKLP
ncbi:MAG: SDR family oxidoreductase [Candidatus Eremiobacteraeota bacterium]|nr:SDR family oxidoreductase [Candidatus Eremiobacteraeota bacterium]MBV8643577.1 SDR family oxidoreductase [Candidatus Eremiobacteraeota bacterium]